jgi:CubicO group peptidase (beta-lactamase class C family)
MKKLSLVVLTVGALFSAVLHNQRPTVAAQKSGYSATAAAQESPKSATIAAQKAAGSQISAEHKARITRIENGLLPAVVVKGQPAPTMTVADRMKHHHVPGVSAAFFDHGQLAWTRAYGFADVGAKTPVTLETLFQAASISKPVSALAMLRLVQEGKLSLDEDVNAKLLAWKVPENEFTKEQKVTLRRIASHSAGLTVHGFPGYASDEAIPTVEQILNGEKPANTAPIRVDTVPGTLWRYSGGGYVVMQLLLTEVTGKPFPQILHDLVLQPAGMTHSTYDQPLPKSFAGSAATPYRSDGGPVKGGPHTYPEMAPAGLWTTPSDLARLAIEVQNEYAGKSHKILSQEMIGQMLTRQKGDWGLGFGLQNSGAQLLFAHGGANEGYRCDLEAYAETGQGFAIMTNSDSGGALASEYLRAVAKEYGWPNFQPIERTLGKADPALFPAYAGKYEITGMGKLTVSTKDGKLFILAEPLGPEPQELLPESSTQFFVLAHEVSFVFEKDEKGALSKLLVKAGSQAFEAKKLP